MKSHLVAAAAGVIFALGLVVSGMTEPAKVTAFLDVTGAWDPTLAFVIVAAILVHAPTVWFVRLLEARHHRPMFDARIHWPTQRGIDLRLVGGAALFGVGWGLSGYCPGPALVAIVGGAPAAAVFVASMLVGIVLVRVATRRSSQP